MTREALSVEYAAPVISEFFRERRLPKWQSAVLGRLSARPDPTAEVPAGQWVTTEHAWKWHLVQYLRVYGVPIVGLPFWQS
jgi:hypothetical protein